MKATTPKFRRLSDFSDLVRIPLPTLVDVSPLVYRMYLLGSASLSRWPASCEVSDNLVKKRQRSPTDTICLGNSIRRSGLRGIGDVRTEPLVRLLHSEIRSSKSAICACNQNIWLRRTGEAICPRDCCRQSASHRRNDQSTFTQENCFCG
jgi:hypothetical protein